MSRAGARTGLQLQGHGDMQGLNSPSLALHYGVSCYIHCRFLNQLFHERDKRWSSIEHPLLGKAPGVPNHHASCELGKEAYGLPWQARKYALARVA